MIVLKRAFGRLPKGFFACTSALGIIRVNENTQILGDKLRNLCYTFQQTKPHENVRKNKKGRIL